VAQDNPKNPSWKQGGAANRPAAKESRKPWQPPKQSAAAKTVDPRARSRKRGAMAGLFGAVLITAMIIVFSLLGCHRPPAVLVIAPDTNMTLSSPANVFGANSVQALVEWSKADESSRPRIANASASSGRNNWMDALEQKEKAIILYFAAHGAADRNGPYLWIPPADAAGIDESHKLHVKEILQRLADPKLKDKHKLVIFDATQVSASWAHGYLHNNFARALKELDPKIAEIDKLVVICSSDDDQRSWVIEEHKRTAFGYFLEAGLKTGAGSNDSVVNASVLFNYVSTEVEKWVRSRRDADQTPILLPIDKGKQRAAEIDIVRNPKDKNLPAADLSFSVPADLRAAWQSAESLADREPPPETAAPFVWRTYLDTLLRWEYLVRAGAPTDQIQRRFEALERQLRKDIFDSDPPCLANSLALPLSFGMTIDPLSDAAFNGIWRPGKDDKPGDIWEGMLNTARAKGGERAVTLLRLAGVSKVLELIERSKESFAETLENAARVLALVDKGELCPIESHLVQVLQREGDKAVPGALAIRAFKLRVDAERVALLAGAPGSGYAYAEQVHRWIRGPIREADRERQRGEDLLFAGAGDTDSSNRSADHFSKAETLYKDAAANGRIAAQALRLRDRVFSRLPYYARWMAGYRGSLPPGEIERMLRLIEKIADDSHQLSQFLEEVPEQPAKKLGEINGLAKRIDAGVKELDTTYEAEWRKTTSNALPSNWHALDSVLTLPFLKTADRVKLLQDLRIVSRELLQKGQVQTGQAPATTADAKMFAQRQGRMALAVLGDRWIKDEVARQTAPRGTLTLYSKGLRERIDEQKTNWWDSINEAAEQIGWHWRMMTPSIHKDLDEAAEVDLKNVPGLLTRASYLNRMLDSATPLAADRSPAAEDRRYWVHELLLWQAQRSAEDGWARLDRDGPGKEYCEEAGERYAFSAQKLILGNAAAESTEGKRRLQAVDKTRKLLTAPQFDTVVTRTLTLTENRPWSMNYRVAPREGRTDGYPILRVRPADGTIRLAGTNLLTRQRIDAFADAKPATEIDRSLSFAFAKVDKENVRGKVHADLLYRGRSFDMSTAVAVMSRPDIEWIYEPPTGEGRVAILGDKGLQQGAICLLIDVSWSMDKPVQFKDADGRAPKKIEAAISAINEVLDGLPDGTMLSIALFYGDGKAEKEHVHWLIKPTRWGQTATTNDEIKKAVKGIKLNQLVDQFSPVVKSLEFLIDEGQAFPNNKDFVGFRSIVLVTDGEDNDPRVKKGHGKQITDLLCAPRNDDIALHMILFSLDRDEEKRAIRQFEGATNDEKFKLYDRTPATIWTGVQTQKDLVEKLKKSMLPTVKVLTGVERVDRIPDGLPVSLIKGRSFNWSPLLKEGTYELLALRSRKRLQLERGDRLLLEMVPEGNRLELRVPLYADVIAGIDKTKRADSKDGRSHLTVTDNFVKDMGKSIDLKVVTTLERLTKVRQEELRIQRPWFVWFEVTPLQANGDAKPTFVRIKNLHQRVASAWEVDVTSWPAGAGQTGALLHPAQPRIRAWWVDALPGNDGQIPNITLDKLAETAARHKVVTVDRTKVSIENITVEDGFLKVAMEHDPDQPIVVRAPGLKKEDQRLQLDERHYFYKATDKQSKDKYVAHFGPLEKDDYTRQFSLQFFTLEHLKERASSIEFDAEKPKKDPENLLEIVK
jgi:Caspase domain